MILKKRDIPAHLLKYFRLKKENRWILRNKIVWHKPNPMPESAKDRFTRYWEYIYFFTKAKKYWFDLDSVRERTTTDEHRTERILYNGKSEQTSTFLPPNPSGKNPGDVWRITTQPFPEVHFATFPEELARRCIKAGCPKAPGIMLDPFGGSGRACHVAWELERDFTYIDIKDEYAEMAKRGIEKKMRGYIRIDDKLQAEIMSSHSARVSLFLLKDVDK